MSRRRSFTGMDYEALERDHPEWKYMLPAEVHRRFWMYSDQWVALARAEVARRRLLAAFGLKARPKPKLKPMTRHPRHPLEIEARYAEARERVYNAHPDLVAAADREAVETPGSYLARNRLALLVEIEMDW